MLRSVLKRWSKKTMPQRLLWDKATTENALPTASRLLWETTQLHLVWFRYSILYTSYLKHRDFPHPLVCCCVPISTGFNPYFFRVSSFDPKFMVFNSNVCWFNLHLCGLFVSMLMNVHPHCCCWSHPLDHRTASLTLPRPPSELQVPSCQAPGTELWEPAMLVINDGMIFGTMGLQTRTKLCTVSASEFFQQLQIAVESQFSGVSGDTAWKIPCSFLDFGNPQTVAVPKLPGSASWKRRPPWGCEVKPSTWIGDTTQS